MNAELKPSTNGIPAKRRFLAGDDGAVTMVLAVCGSLMVGALCGAIDMIHYEMTQARMQMALDVATLSAGANLAHFDTTKSDDYAKWQAEARAYYNANMPSGYFSLSMPDSNFKATVTGKPATGQTIQLSASGSMPLLAPIFLSNKTSTGSGSTGSGSGGSGTTSTQVVNASNTALRQPKSTLELVMVLDNSTSMNQAASKTDSSQKMDGLKTAAKNLVTNLFSQTTNDSFVGLVPFTTMVNVKNVLPASNTKWMNWKDYSQYNASGTDPNNWRGCPVEPRDANNNLQPKAYAPKDIPGFRPWYWNVPPKGFTVQNYQTTYGYYTYRGQQYQYVTSYCSAEKPQVVTGLPLYLQSDGGSSYCSVSGNPSTGIYTAWGQPDPSSGQTFSYDQNFNTTYYSNSNNSSTTYATGPCEIAPALFLTKNSSTITTAVNNMTPNGNTLIPTGLLWGWRMLSSDWSQNVAGTANGFSQKISGVSSDPTLPRPESTQALQRVLIVLTDGENAFGSNYGIMAPPWFNGLSGVGDYTLRAPSVTRSSTKKAMTDGVMTSTDDINDFQLAVCTAIKQSGVVIYSITFGTYGTDSDSINAQATMQSCASPGNYYHAPNNTTLDAIFQQIAGNLGVLRLTQ